MGLIEQYTELRTAFLSLEKEVEKLSQDEGSVNPASVTQAEAEAGTETSLRSWSPERVAQAIAALGAALTEGDGVTISAGVISFGGSATSNIGLELINTNPQILTTVSTAGYASYCDMYQQETGWELDINAGDGEAATFKVQGAGGGEIEGDWSITAGPGSATTGNRRILMSSGGNFIVTDSMQSKGMQYAADYSTNYTDRSIPDKAYVDPSLTADVSTSYDFVIGDANNVVTLNNASPVSATIPANASVAYPVGTEIKVINLGAGTVTIGITSDTLNHDVGGLTLTQYAKRTLTKVATTTWILGY